MPRFGWYGDDFTGATDTLACLAEAGQRALLFPRLPSAAQLSAAGELDAVGIAGATRAMAPGAIAAELAPVGRFFAGLGVRVLHYKCCSTFDSAPGIGSIGAAVLTLRQHMPHGLLPIVGGQPNLGRYCVFSTLFASAGSGGAVHRLDRHPTMARHPVTPMHEADLRRHLEAQGLPDIAALHYPAYEAAGSGVAAVLDRLAHVEAPPAVLLDVARAADLALLGPALWRQAEHAPMLAVGPSSVVQALSAAWPERPPPPPGPMPPAEGPVFVLVGSLSPISRRQADAATSYTQIEISAETLVAAPQDLLDRIATTLRAGRSVLLRTADPAGHRISADDATMVAQRGAELVTRLLQAVPVRRLGIAGGDTSSYTAKALDIWALAYRRTLAPGVTLCLTRSERQAMDGVEIMLKGGQMGPPDLFETLLHGSSR
jgi:uncharacterized protein YgbK (DUF1537 family)